MLHKEDFGPTTEVFHEGVTCRTWMSLLNVLWFRGFGADAGSPGKLLVLCRLWWGGCTCLWWVSGRTRRWWLWAAVAQGRPRPASHFPRSCWNKREQREEALPVSASTSVFVAIERQKTKALNMNLHTGWMDSLEPRVVTGSYPVITRAYSSHSVTCFALWICVNLLLLMLNDRWNAIATV